MDLGYQNAQGYQGSRGYQAGHAYQGNQGFKGERTYQGNQSNMAYQGQFAVQGQFAHQSPVNNQQSTFQRNAGYQGQAAYQNAFAQSNQEYAAPNSFNMPVPYAGNTQAQPSSQRLRVFIQTSMLKYLPVLKQSLLRQGWQIMEFNPQQMYQPDDVLLLSDRRIPALTMNTRYMGYNNYQELVDFLNFVQSSR